MAIGALSARTGCNIETIRYYERVGLLPVPTRSAGGYRLYEAGHADRLAFIRRARTLGFTLNEVRALLALAEKRNSSCAEVRDIATVHLADVRTKLSALRTMERVLSRTIMQCSDGTRPHCPLIEALSADTIESRLLSGPRIVRTRPRRDTSGRKRREKRARKPRKLSRAG